MLVDGAQSVPHMPVDVQALDVDFMAVSGHKMCAPTGIGFLYGKRALLEAMPPFLTGGDMIRTVAYDTTTFDELPWKFEAGTSNIADAIALRRRLRLPDGVGMDWIREHEIAHHALRARTAGAVRRARPATSTVRREPKIAAASSRSTSPTSTRTIWPRSSTSKASASAPATTARCR